MEHFIGRQERECHREKRVCTPVRGASARHREWCPKGRAVKPGVQTLLPGRPGSSPTFCYFLAEGPRMSYLTSLRLTYEGGS